jgi:phosphohistidine phosphatase
MRLILIRHGKAEEPDEAHKKDDALRALTPEGRRKMKAAAKGLRELIPKIDLLATSPKKRAVQTAQVVYAAYNDKPQFVELDLLAGGSPQKIIAWIKAHDLDAATVGFVGHEPYLSRWAGWFTTGREKSIVALKKGAVCIIDFPAALVAGKGVIFGLFQPADLRRLS